MVINTEQQHKAITMYINVGDYLMHHMHGSEKGALVRVDSRSATEGCYGVQYVQVRHDNSDVISGGYSSSWPASDFRAITDPALLAASKCFEANREARDLEERAAILRKEAAVWRNAMQAIIVCKTASEPTTA
jgi:hypothetical protein